MKSDEVIAAEAALIKCAISAEAPVPFAKASSTTTVRPARRGVLHGVTLGRLPNHLRRPQPRPALAAAA